jgi:hypothetical protein
MDPSEEELEECIIVKSLKDWNNAQFSNEVHAVINSIITDVFTLNIHNNKPTSSSLGSDNTEPKHF